MWVLFHTETEEWSPLFHHTRSLWSSIEDRTKRKKERSYRCKREDFLEVSNIYSIYFITKTDDEAEGLDALLLSDGLSDDEDNPHKILVARCARNLIQHKKSFWGLMVLAL